MEDAMSVTSSRVNWGTEFSDQMIRPDHAFKSFSESELVFPQFPMCHERSITSDFAVRKQQSFKVFFLLTVVTNFTTTYYCYGGLFCALCILQYVNLYIYTHFVYIFTIWFDFTNRLCPKPQSKWLSQQKGTHSLYSYYYCYCDFTSLLYTL